MIGLDFGFNNRVKDPWRKINYRKNTKRSNTASWNGLTNKEEFILEKTCLEKLNSNFRCLCKKKSNHFPKLISASNGVLKLTNCGISLNKYKKYVKYNEIDPIVIKNKEEQINCILHNLEKNKVKHLDMVTNGKNLCVSKTGVLSLIDFNIASINNEYTTDKIKNRLSLYGKENSKYNIFMKNRIMKTIKNTM